MLLKFKVENFMSFRDQVCIDFEAAPIREMPENVATLSTQSFDHRVLRSVALYGANSSGKSNLLRAFACMRNIILKSQSEDSFIKLESYRLDDATEKRPSLFEATMIIGKSRYRYGFVMSTTVVEKEWLYITEKRKEEPLFERTGNSFVLDRRFKSEAEGTVQLVAKITKPNLLFISSLSQFKSDTVNSIVDWFERSFVIFNSNSGALINYTASLLKEIYYKSRIMKIINKSDLSFSSIEAEIKATAARTGLEEGVIGAFYSNGTTSYRIKTIHEKKVRETYRTNIAFDLEENESVGSKKFVALLGPLLTAMRQASIIWIDELDASLHTNLLQFVLQIFNSNLNNPKGSQLVYTSHNTNILKKNLRRDQMVFVKRDNLTGSQLTSLHAWDSKVRSDATFDKDYLEGKYEAVPKIDLSPDLFD